VGFKNAVDTYDLNICSDSQWLEGDTLVNINKGLAKNATWWGGAR
jgi:hypothetical protein